MGIIRQAILSVLLCLLPMIVSAQRFDFEKLQREAERHTVIVEMDIELSFGLQSTEQKQRMLGTIVSGDGLVVFDGSSLLEGAGMSPLAGFSVKTTPTTIKVHTLDDKTYDAAYLGADRFTRLGFVRIQSDEDRSFEPVHFTTNYRFEVGDWLALYMLMPEFVTPPLAADIGMVSTIVQSPEYFPLTVGFGPSQVGVVLYDERLEPVGILGQLLDPSSANTDQGGMLESFGETGIPMLGVITGERLNRLIVDPPRKGKEDRGWLGISLQALTKDIADFLGFDVPGGIIVNDVVKGSPADRGGLLTGDVIYTVNGQPVTVDKEEKVPIFQRLIADMGPSASVEFGVFRPHETTTDTLTVLITLGSAPIAASEASEYESDLLEMKVRNLVFADYMMFNLDQDTFKGVIVSELKPGGLARVGGLQLGDVIQQVNNIPVDSVEDIERILTDIESQQPPEIIFFVWRHNKTLFINVKTDWPEEK